MSNWMVRAGSLGRAAAWWRVAALGAVLTFTACSGASPDDDDSPTPPDSQGTDVDKDGYTVEAGDCDDDNAAVNPGADEKCDGIDNNCNDELDGASSIDAQTYYYDGDRDAYGVSDTSLIACDAPAGYAEVDGDCDDDDSAVNPGEAELCDGIDNNCNDELDGANSEDAQTFYLDLDRDTYGDPDQAITGCNAPGGYIARGGDCNDNNAAIHPGVSEVCDGVDNDCDGEVDGQSAVDALTYYADVDGDSHGNPNSSIKACSPPNRFVLSSDDCNDQNSAVYPGATELQNGIDDDCDGKVDEGGTNTDDDGDGFSEAQGDCNDNDAAVSPIGSEFSTTCDGRDQDCDGKADDGLTCHDDDGDGYTEDGGDCNDASNSTYPGAPEDACNTVDNNCDGFTGPCTDRDGDGFSTDDGDCNDFDDTIYPGAPELRDGKDNDCDGIIDDGDVPAGAVIVTEINLNPVGTDTLGEWFELYNTQSYAIDLFNWRFRDNYTSDGLPGSPIYVNEHVVIPAYSYALFGSCDGGGGVDLDFAYYQCAGGYFALSNSASSLNVEQILLYDSQGNLVDETYYTDGVDEGDTKQLDRDYVNFTYGPSFNDDASNPSYFCETTGTPRAPNANCF